MPLPNLDEWECIGVDKVKTPEYHRIMTQLIPERDKYLMDHPARDAIVNEMVMAEMVHTYYRATFKNRSDPSKVVAYRSPDLTDK